TEAQDIVQVVMIKMWEKRTELTALDNLKAYLMRAIKNECLNKMRQLEMSATHQARAQSLEPQLVDYNKGNMAQIIRRFIPTLPEKQQLVILLKDIEEFETNEIAAMLEMDENAVRTNLARARQKVRAYLQKIELYEQQQIQ
ncbi:MAG: RNA polymerase sigma factor, partial [Chitinophagaceae bacterium]